MGSLLQDGRISRSADASAAELRHDLAATWDVEAAPDSVAAWLSRPAILRRVADALGALVGADVDRLVADGPGAASLATATSLVTGLPFAVFGPSGKTFGFLHDGETIALLSVDGRPQDTHRVLSSRSCRVAGRFTVVGQDGIDDHGLFVSSLYSPALDFVPSPS